MPFILALLRLIRGLESLTIAPILNFRPRLLSVVVILAVMMLGVRTQKAVVDSRVVLRNAGIGLGSEVIAGESKPAAEEAKKITEEKQEGADKKKTEEAIKAKEEEEKKKAEADKIATEKKEEAAPKAESEKKAESDKGVAEDAAQDKPKVKAITAIDPLKITDGEAEVLRLLIANKESMQSQEDKLRSKQELTEAMTKKLDEKIAEMTRLKKDLDQRLSTKKGIEDGKMKGLVKVYEAMKPDEAAKILDELSLDVLLPMFELMAQKKVSLILARMSPEKARTITGHIAILSQSRIPV